MANLDNLASLKELDQENILGNIQDFPDQVEKCWSDWKNIALPTPFVNAKNILILGMGGSAQGGGIASDLAKLSSSIPIMSLRDYDAPSWVDKNTLVIAASYSGGTEETIEALKQITKKTDKIITISTGGEIYSIGSQHRALHYQIHYGSQPRAALGYMLTSILAIFKKLNILDITDNDIDETILLIRGLKKKIDADVPLRRNPAKTLASKLVGKIPIIYGGGTLTEVARRYKGQFNENAKTISYYETIPELNHNSLVGLEFPDYLKQKFFFLILQSKYDHERNKIRQQITAQILQQKRIQYETIMIQPTSNAVAEVMQTIYYGDYVSYYLAILNNIAPNPVDIIKYLKDKLAEKPIEN
jgi:glucose/mannose-6-phosphate isomerase